MKFVAGAFVNCTGQLVGQIPSSPCEIVPTGVYAGLCRKVAEIDRNKIPFIVLTPAPGNNILPAWVIGPSGAFGFRAELCEPHPSVDLINCRISRTGGEAR